MNDEKPFNPYDASRPVDERNINPPVIPDYVSQTRAWLEANPSRIQDALPVLIKGTDLKTLVVNYIKDHPNSIPEIINEQYPDLREKLNSLGVLEQAGLDMAKAKFPPLGFLIDAIKEGKVEISPDVSSQDLAERLKDNVGLTNVGLGRQTPEDMQENDPEDFMTTQDVQDIIEYMAGLSEQGLALPEIADAVWRDYRVEYHPLKIKRMLKAYYARPDEEEKDEDNPEQSDNPQAKAIHKVLSEASRLKIENERLKAKEAEAMRKSEIDLAVKEAVSKIQPPLNSKPGRVGLIRKIGRALW